MACIRKRRGKWVADWRDGSGVRRWRTFDAKPDAEDFLDIERQKSRQWSQPTVAANTTLDAYTKHWLALIRGTVKPRTADGYQKLLNDHLLPIFGPLPVRHIHRGRIKSLLADKLSSGLARNTVRNIHAALRALLRAAVDDGLLSTNPAERLGRQMRLITSHTARQEQIKAMTLEQRQAFLASAEQEPAWHPFFATIAGTGLRLGEVLALQWDDLDLGQRTLRVARAFSLGRLELPKAGHGRTVDISVRLTQILLGLSGVRQAEKTSRGWEELPPWVFCSEVGTPLDDGNVRRAMARILKAAKLPEHFSPHCLRHTYASLLLQAGESPAYVQRQLGHASIQLTVDTYGKWLPTVNHGAVDRLDGSETVAASLLSSS